MATYKVLGDVTLALLFQMEWDRESSDSTFEGAVEEALLNEMRFVLGGGRQVRPDDFLEKLQDCVVEVVYVYDEHDNEYSTWDLAELDEEDQDESDDNDDAGKAT